LFHLNQFLLGILAILGILLNQLLLGNLLNQLLQLRRLSLVYLLSRLSQLHLGNQFDHLFQLILDFLDLLGNQLLQLHPYYLVNQPHRLLLGILLDQPYHYHLGNQ
jgi:hypothetical protein